MPTTTQLDLAFPDPLPPMPSRNARKRYLPRPHPCDLDPLELYNLGLDRDSLFARNRKLAYRAVRLLWAHPGIRQMGWEDAFQEAQFALFRSTETFDRAMGCKLSTAAFRCIRNALLSACGKYHPGVKCKRQGAVRVVSIDAPDEDGKTLAGRLMDEDDMPEISPGTLDPWGMVDSLPPGERRVVRMCCLLGQSTKRVARVLGWSVEKVRARKAAGLERLRGMLSQE